MKVLVSNLGDYMFCPRNLYLKEKLGLGAELRDDSAKGFLLHHARRELSLRQHLIVEKAGDFKGIRKAVSDELDLILPDLAQRHGERLEDVDLVKLVPKLEDELSTDVRRLCDRLSYLISEAGHERAIEKITPWRTDYLVESETLGLRGIADKVLKEGGNYYPVDIKTTVPGESVWEADKVLVCAYSLLIEEALNSGKPISSGFVEYVRVHETRPVMNSEDLRKKVHDVRDEVISLLEGDIPDICPHGSGRKCDSCSIKDECYEV
jgi:CRISPR/Cas system-associated exonuclease Cas4 (RecB family)